MHDNKINYINNAGIATIPDGTTVIEPHAFQGCKNLKSVKIPDSVTSIGKSAFNFCQSLKSITIPDSVTNIGDDVFSGCLSLESITIPNGVTSIGDDTFWGCSSIKSITIPNGVTSIGEWAFSSCESLESITIPDSVVSIGKSAFLDCKSLKKITIPNSMTSISESAFCGCKTIIMYNKIPYPSYVFSSKNTLPFIKESSYENLMRIKEFLIKARLALDYIDSDTRFVDCVRENCTNLIKQATENEDWDALDKIFNSEHNLLRPKQLDECMKFAIENNYHELSILLMQYKENTGNYDKDDNRFELGVIKEK